MKHGGKTYCMYIVDKPSARNYVKEDVKGFEMISKD
jgi:hypothetical protein